MGNRHRLWADAVELAEQVAKAGYHVSVRIYPDYGRDEPQPDPLLDVWRTARQPAGFRHIPPQEKHP